MSFEQKPSNTILFDEFERMSLQYKAIDLTKGCPDFLPHRFIPEAIKTASSHQVHQYCSQSGLAKLRDLIAERYEKSGLKFDPETEITVTNGAQQALFLGFAAVLNPGDEILVIEPAFFSYYQLFSLLKVTPCSIHLNANDLSIPFDEIKAAIKVNTKAILINSPHNPTGKVFSGEELSEIAKIACANNLLIISDEVFEAIVFDGFKHRSIAANEGCQNRTITISSFGKTLGITGWRLGWVAAPKEITSKIRDILSATTGSLSHPLQVATITLFEKFDEIVEYNLNVYKSNLKILQEALSSGEFKFFSTQGSFFVTCDVSNQKSESDFEICKKLITEIGVAALPLSPFMHAQNNSKKWIRFCFAKDKTMIEKAAERISRKIKWTLCLLGTLILSTSLQAHAKSDTKKILVVHSYNTDFDWTNVIDKAIRSEFSGSYSRKDSGLYKRFKVSVTSEFMDTKNHSMPNEIQEKANNIINKIKSSPPDLIIISDDNALNYVGKPLKDGLIPIVFCGVNGDPVKTSMVKSFANSGNQLTGVLERYAFVGTIQLAEQLVGRNKKVYVLADASEVGESILQEFEEKRKTSTFNQLIKQAKYEIQPVFKSNKWSDWQVFLKSIDPKNSIVIFFAFFSVKNDEGRIVSIKEFQEWVKENTQIPDFGFVARHVSDGFLAGIGVSGERQGVAAARIAQRILSGTKPSQIIITNPEEYRLNVSAMRAKQLGIKVPLKLLIFATQSDHYYRSKPSFMTSGESK
jgi:aspartate/methionine/tyrosine aminotransferase/ABC-type uncharacterized transport system substrate-binding protein